jgi:hypothetical protein
MTSVERWQKREEKRILGLRDYIRPRGLKRGTDEETFSRKCSHFEAFAGLSIVSEVLD